MIQTECRAVFESQCLLKRVYVERKMGWQRHPQGKGPGGLRGRATRFRQTGGDWRRLGEPLPGPDAGRRLPDGRLQYGY